MPSIILCLYNGNRLVLADHAGVIGLMFHHKTNEWITYKETDITWLTWIFLRQPTGAFNYCNPIWIFQNDVTGNLVGDNLFKVC